MRRPLTDGFELDDDPTRIDVDAVQHFLAHESYWGQGRTHETVRATIAGSLRVVGLYRGEQQVGFARAVSDGVTVAYLADVYVLEPYRSRGLGVELVREIVDGGEASSLAHTHWLLHTADAQALYKRLGFLDGPSRYPLMERPRGYDHAS